MQPPFKEIEIKDLDKGDIKISVTGILVSKNENSLVMDDGTGNVLVFIDTPLEVNSFCKVFGTVLPQEEGLAIQGQVIQDLSSVNQDLYKKMRNYMEPKQAQQK